MSVPSIFPRFLGALGVPHTRSWSESRFRGMTFKSLYGLSHLLSQYGIPNQAVQFTDKTGMTKLATPFLAQTNAGIFVIVTAIDPEKGTVQYDSHGEIMQTSLDNFLNACNGIVLLAFPGQDSVEPEYFSHRMTEIIEDMSRYALVLCACIVFVYFYLTRGLYAWFSTNLLIIFNCVGLYFSLLLLQKSLNIHTKASDRVCGVLEQGGCDSIMELKVSKLFGVFSWSEIGFAYFGVSLTALLVFPRVLPYLAVCNLCCLPYTFWSIWYQKFRAKHWCTLCVGVQSTLWLLFFCYLSGGWFKYVLPLHVYFFILLATYLFVTLFINMLLGVFKKLPCHETHSKT